jgi:uncharacterized protein YjbJ (UPF0337 family)
MSMSNEAAQISPVTDAGRAPAQNLPDMDDANPGVADSPMIPTLHGDQEPSSDLAAITAENPGVAMSGAVPQSGENSGDTRQRIMPSANINGIKGRWIQLTDAAKVAWGRLTAEELLKSAGQERNLVRLVQQRYELTREAARKQVRDFFARHTN